MFSIYDMYILGSCAFTLACWCLCVWFDKDNNKGGRND
jgi:hypothetical protein